MDNSEPAFGHFVPDGHYNGSMHFEGLTKREWFVGMALQGILGSPANLKGPEGGNNFDEIILSRMAFIVADAMIEESRK